MYESTNKSDSLKILLLFILSLCLHAPHLTAKELSVGWELWYPYQYHNSESELVGLDIESFKAIMAQANLSYTTAEIPWKTHLHFLKTGKMDMAMGASWAKDREEYAYFSLPYRKETVKLYVKSGRANSIKLNNLSDLIGSPYIIGVESGYYYGKEYEALMKKADFRENISEVIDIEENVSLLLKGHLDGFLVDPNTMQSFINKYSFEDQFEQHPLEIYSADIFIMLSKKTTDVRLLNRINLAIETLQNNGALTMISDNWEKKQINK